MLDFFRFRTTLPCWEVISHGPCPWTDFPWPFSSFGPRSTITKLPFRTPPPTSHSYFSSFRGCRVLGYINQGWLSSLRHSLHTHSIGLGWSAAITAYTHTGVRQWTRPWGARACKQSIGAHTLKRLVYVNSQRHRVFWMGILDTSVRTSFCRGPGNINLHPASLPLRSFVQGSGNSVLSVP